jgi:hypothetical protein
MSTPNRAPHPSQYTLSSGNAEAGIVTVPSSSGQKGQLYNPGSTSPSSEVDKSNTVCRAIMTINSREPFFALDVGELEVDE